MGPKNEQQSTVLGKGLNHGRKIQEGATFIRDFCVYVTLRYQAVVNPRRRQSEYQVYHSDLHLFRPSTLEALFLSIPSIFSLHTTAGR